MEKKKEEDQSAFRPWADLPETLAEIVLELLPLVDYIHFATVCRRWQSIQMEHRLRNSPSPPPMPHNLPWLVSYNLCPLPSRPRDTGTDCDDDEEEGLLESYSPLEKKHYSLPFPPGLRRSRHLLCLASCRGWLFMTSHEPHGRPHSSSNFITEPFLFNPITRTSIPLPPLSITKNQDHLGALSAPPTDPECTLLFVDHYKGAFLHWLRGGGGWTRVVYAYQEVACTAIACGGKFYCQYRIMRVGVIDPLLPEPRLLIFDWDLGMPRLADWDLFRMPLPGMRLSCLVEHDGEMCILLTVRLATFKEFRLFRADLSAKEWVRVETLSDRVILVDWPCALSLVAADVGLKKNTIYCSQYSQDDEGTRSWRAFDWDTGGWIAGTQVSYLEVGCRSGHNRWFLPTLDWVGTIQTGQ